jgi:dolichyl-phosphate-mannose--protein O-mannosyl transferase
MGWWKRRYERVSDEKHDQIEVASSCVIFMAYYLLYLAMFGAMTISVEITNQDGSKHTARFNGWM